jgi:hypothetical protein
MNNLCTVDYPHNHVRDHGNPHWRPTIDDPAVSAPWPDRLKWERRSREFNGRNPYRLFHFGWFASHSGFQLPWKFVLDGDTGWEDLAEMIAWKFAFRSVYGIPTGGEKLARALDQYCEPNYPVLIVDDVLTTSRSMEEARARLGNPDPVIGVVVAARGPCPSWVFPILTINEFFQSRATGLG